MTNDFAIGMTDGPSIIPDTKNAPFWTGRKRPHFPLPKTPFKTGVVVEGF
jgi:hypothetical protein